jgi:hypothetical protein
MGTPFKMKGSPMQRNFGIGTPLKQAYKDNYNPEANKKAADYSDKKYDYSKFDFLKTDYASGYGVGDLTTIKRLNMHGDKNRKKGKDYKDY